MTAPLRLTIAIPTYNRAEYLRQTLAGIARQNFPRAFYEVLVIDNNSRDHTRAVVESFAQEKPAPRYILETRQGANFARNRAIDEAKGEIVIFADDDILVESDWLTELAAPFAADEHEKIGAVAGEVVPVFPDGCPPWVADFHGPQALRKDAGETRAGQVPMSANLAFRRRVLDEIGRFDIEVGRRGKTIFGGEENLPIHRLRRAGYTVWFAPSARVLHQMPAARTTLRYVMRHAFDSARSRVVGRVNLDKSENRSSRGYLLSRLPGNVLKVLMFSILALLNLLILRQGEAKKNLVRAWRSCGYLYQIPRTLSGKI